MKKYSLKTGVPGFKFSAVMAGIKQENTLDVGLIVSEQPCSTVGVFTRNKVKAAPVINCQKKINTAGIAQAVLVNSGNANACTGQEGMEAALQTSRLVAESLHIPEDMVLLASTGVIGLPLKVAAFEQHMSALVANLSEENFDQVAEAIMTTDTVPKIVARTVDIGEREVKFLGMAKGSGMIMPNMATMLAFVLTDAQISFPELNRALKSAVERTFNRITVDGDTSTNDMVLVMANGTAENPWIEDDQHPDYGLFADCLEEICKDLALKIVEDGEGATKRITVRVCGAKEDRDAEQIARTVANSNLVKTAFFGEDANWGRILGAMGRSGVRFNPDKVDIAFGDAVIVKNGIAQGREAEDKASQILKNKQFTVCIDLQDGTGCEEVYTCDLSLDYVKINADYRS